MILNCIAVDDEPVPLSLLCDYINRTPFLKLSGKYHSAVEALNAIHENKIDVIFLDIRMHDLDGIEFAKIIDQSYTKGTVRIIFTTAYNQYAIESYKVDALDYLLKPFNFVDFSRAAIKAQSYFNLLLNHKKTTEDVLEGEKQYLYLKADYQLLKVDLNDILYIESMKDYVKIYLINEPNPIVTLSSLKTLEEKLPTKSFMRIHRSFIVAIDKIRLATKGTVIMAKTTIPVTDPYKKVFQQYLDKWA